jgi:hypothetical protein
MFGQPWWLVAAVLNVVFAVLLRFFFEGRVRPLVRVPLVVPSQASRRRGRMWGRVFGG